MNDSEAWRFDLCERLGLCCAAGATWTVDEVLQHIESMRKRATPADDAGKDAGR